METKNISIGGKSYKIKELSYSDGLKLVKVRDDLEAHNKLLIELSVVEPKVNTEELPLREGGALVKEINEFNGASSDFTKPLDGKQDTPNSG